MRASRQRSRRLWASVAAQRMTRTQELEAIEAFLADRGVSTTPTQVLRPVGQVRAAALAAEPDPHVLIWTDGSCLGNPGPGGWAAILQAGEKEKQITGSERRTTNNQMELLAVIKALQALTRPGLTVRVHTDSMYVIGGMTKGTVKRRQRMRQTVVPNAHLWAILDAIADDYTLQWRWVRGHAGDTMNERCDRLALAAASRQR